MESNRDLVAKIVEEAVATYREKYGGEGTSGYAYACGVLEFKLLRALDIMTDKQLAEYKRYVLRI